MPSFSYHPEYVCVCVCVYTHTHTNTIYRAQVHIELTQTHTQRFTFDTEKHLNAHCHKTQNSQYAMGTEQKKRGGPKTPVKTHTTTRQGDGRWEMGDGRWEMDALLESVAFCMSLCVCSSV